MVDQASKITNLTRLRVYSHTNSSVRLYLSTAVLVFFLAKQHANVHNDKYVHHFSMLTFTADADGNVSCRYLVINQGRPTAGADVERETNTQL